GFILYWKNRTSRLRGCGSIRGPPNRPASPQNTWTTVRQSPRHPLAHGAGIASGWLDSLQRAALVLPFQHAGECEEPRCLSPGVRIPVCQEFTALLRLRGGEATRSYFKHC